MRNWLKHFKARFGYLLRGDFSSFWNYWKGYQGLEYRGIPILETEDCPPDTMYFLNPNSYYVQKHLKKDGTLDYRYSANKWLKGIK